MRTVNLMIVLAIAIWFDGELDGIGKLFFRKGLKKEKM